MFLRSSFNYDRDQVSSETGFMSLEESLAIQSAEEESNINTIVRKFGLTGELPNDLSMPQSGEFHDIPDFHTAMNIIRKTQEEFLRIPAETRARFNNDPQRLMSFLDDESNRAEAMKLGFLRVPPSGTPDGGAPQAE